MNAIKFEGGARGTAPLFVDQTEARRAEKKFRSHPPPPPPPFSQGLDDRLPPLIMLYRLVIIDDLPTV